MKWEYQYRYTDHDHIEGVTPLPWKPLPRSRVAYLLKAARSRGMNELKRISNGQYQIGRSLLIARFATGWTTV